MLIENMMYFALGLLVAGLVALIVMPAETALNLSVEVSVNICPLFV